MGKTRTVIIGAGISGVSAADELIKLGHEVIILEKNDRLGGKIYSDREHKKNGVVPELGAVVFTSNYPAIDTVMKHQIETQPLLPIDYISVNQIVYGKKHPNFFDKMIYAIKFLWQNVKFSCQVWSYNAATYCYACKPPIGQSETFDKFCQKQGLDAIARFQKIWLPGMGYGDLQQNATYRVFGYMGYTTMLSLALGDFISHSLLSVTNGYQTIVEKLAENMNVETAVNITNIKRMESGVVIHYTKNGEEKCIYADNLVLTMSPYYWETLNMELTELERNCIKQLQCVPYAAAIVDIEGFSDTQLFVPEALDAKGFGHIGFISTKGEGRCVVYINKGPNQEKFSLAENSPDRQVLFDDLKKLGYDKVKILKTEDWPDYNASIPWELGMQLEKQQGSHGTYYVGTYRPNSFETVASAEVSSRATMRRCFAMKELSYLEAAKINAYRAYNFFFKLPINSKTIGNHQQPEIEKTAQMR